MSKVALLLSVSLAALFHVISSLDVCGLEYLPRCNPYNKTCLTTSMEPGIRNWFAKGRPEYFQDGVEPATFDELIVPISKTVSYRLSNVIINGIGTQSQLTDWIFERDGNGLGVMGYTYNLNIVVKAEAMYRVEKGKPDSCSGPLVARLSNINTVTRLPLWFMTRCTGIEYMAMKDERTTVEHATNQQVILECGKPHPGDHRRFLHALVETAASTATGLLTDAFRVFDTQLELHGYFDFNSQDTPIEQPNAMAWAMAHSRV